MIVSLHGRDPFFPTHMLYWIGFFVQYHGILIFKIQGSFLCLGFNQITILLFLHTKVVSFTGPKPIKFEKVWLSQPGFSELLITWWGAFELQGELGNSWRLKLQFLRQKLRGWNNNYKAEQKRTKKDLLQKLDRFERLVELDELDDNDQQHWLDCQMNLKQIFKDEEAYWQAREKAKWFVEGDANTKFFHIQASIRKKKNSIFSMTINGVIVQDMAVIKDHVTNFYKQLLGTSTSRLVGIQSSLWDNSRNLSLEQKVALERPFTVDEIRKTVFSCNPSKAPGPDGLSFLFYQHFWDIIKDDFMQLVQAFYNNTLDLTRLNMASICLIPKKENASEIKNFRPISLINCSLKIITKCLTDRLALCMDDLIDCTQNAFIKGRLIMDNILVANEVLHSVRIAKVQGVLFKLDFEKAYDMVNWDFLLEVLELRGFGERFISWIKALLVSSKTCININGDLGAYFHCK